MKFSYEKALLSSAVTVASRAVAAKSSIPAMEGILIEAGAQLKLTGYNLETGIQATVPAEIKEGGSLVLSARLLGEACRKMPDDVVVFSSQGYSVNIKCGMYEINILGTDADTVSTDIEKDAERSMLYQAIGSLESRERSIMELRFGLRKGGKEHTQKEVADLIGISQSYISRLEKRIIRRLHNDLKKMNE